MNQITSSQLAQFGVEIPTYEEYLEAQMVRFDLSPRQQLAVLWFEASTIPPYKGWEEEDLEDFWLTPEDLRDWDERKAAEQREADLREAVPSWDGWTDEDLGRYGQTVASMVQLDVEQREADLREAEGEWLEAFNAISPTDWAEAARRPDPRSYEDEEGFATHPSYFN